MPFLLTNYCPGLTQDPVGDNKKVDVLVDFSKRTCAIGHVDMHTASGAEVQGSAGESPRYLPRANIAATTDNDTLTTRNVKRERERETAEGGLANCLGKEDGWGAGGWSWRRKRYGGFCHKIPVPNVFFADFCVLWAGSCGNLRQGA